MRFTQRKVGLPRMRVRGQQKHGDIPNRSPSRHKRLLPRSILRVGALAAPTFLHYTHRPFHLYSTRFNTTKAICSLLNPRFLASATSPPAGENNDDLWILYSCVAQRVHPFGNRGRRGSSRLRLHFRIQRSFRCRPRVCLIKHGRVGESCLLICAVGRYLSGTRYFLPCVCRVRSADERVAAVGLTAASIPVSISKIIFRFSRAHVTGYAVFIM